MKHLVGLPVRRLVRSDTAVEQTDTALTSGLIASPRSSTGPQDGQGPLRQGAKIGGGPNHARAGPGETPAEELGLEPSYGAGLGRPWEKMLSTKESLFPGQLRRPREFCGQFLCMVYQREGI